MRVNPHYAACVAEAGWGSWSTRQRRALRPQVHHVAGVPAEPLALLAHEPLSRYWARERARVDSKRALRTGSIARIRLTAPDTVISPHLPFRGGVTARVVRAAPASRTGDRRETRKAIRVAPDVGARDGSDHSGDA